VVRALATGADGSGLKTQLVRDFFQNLLMFS